MRLGKTIFALCCLALPIAVRAQQSSNDWPAVGGTNFGQRYSAQKQINRSNVSKLQPAWVFHTHIFDPPHPHDGPAGFEATPVLWKRTLYVSSPFDDIFAIDAATGTQVWAFDAQVSREHVYSATSRGVALWHAARPTPGLCGSDTVLLATIDRRLLARDAATGKPCPGFGANGTVDLMKGVLATRTDSLSYTSPPVVVNDTIILGSAIPDNFGVFVASGAIRGFDVRTGAQKWSWEPIRGNEGQQHPSTGSGNAWSLLAADPANDLVFIPTGSASNDFYGGTRTGDNRDADSLVALRASTGERVWAFQLVHHDLWDYDTPSQPLLFTFRKSIPAVAVATKTSMVYVFNRLTGQSLYPIEERPVAQSTLAGEVTSPTQPFSTLPSLTPLTFSANDIHLRNRDDEAYCRKTLQRFDYQGLFTPPSKKGAVIYPGSLGGANWGSASFDPTTSVLYVRVSSMPYLARESDAHRSYSPADIFYRKLGNHLPESLGGKPDPLSTNDAITTPDARGLSANEPAPQFGTPYVLDRQPIVSPGGAPCGPAPFGAIVAIDLDTGRKLWSVPHGQMVPDEPGSIGTGGSIVTAGGLLFAGASMDRHFRAYDSNTGQPLWTGDLPALPQSTPMTYTIDGRQFVVIATGGAYADGKKIRRVDRLCSAAGSEDWRRTSARAAELLYKCRVVAVTGIEPVTYGL